MIDHELKELQELADAGVDVAPCGHTHDGQMFPGDPKRIITVRRMGYKWNTADRGGLCLYPLLL